LPACAVQKVLAQRPAGDLRKLLRWHVLTVSTLGQFCYGLDQTLCFVVWSQMWAYKARLGGFGSCRNGIGR
jgi:hypothetical protein